MSIQVSTLQSDVNVKDPRQTSHLILSTCKQIDQCEKDIIRIKGRGIFKRLFSNNTRDLSVAMLKQNETISMLMKILQRCIFLNIYTSAKLMQVQSDLFSNEQSFGIRNQKYLTISKDYISQAIAAATTFEATMDNLNNKITENEEINERQTREIDNLNNELRENIELDQLQAKQIVKLDKALNVLRRNVSKIENKISLKPPPAIEIQNLSSKYDIIGTQLSTIQEGLGKRLSDNKTILIGVGIVVLSLINLGFVLFIIFK